MKRFAFTLAEGATHVDMLPTNTKAGFTLAEGATHVGLLPTNAKVGFTLAEVLITLGIIGVVAAMTVPTLISHTSCQKFRTGFKKTLATLNQAVKVNSVNYNFDFASVENCKNKDKDTPSNIASICAMINGSLSGKYVTNYHTLKTGDGKPYYLDVFQNAAPDTMIKEQGVELYMYTMTDGSIFAFHSPMAGQSGDIACSLNGATLQERLQNSRFIKFCVAYIDVNGITQPNKEVRCSDGKAHTKDIDSECSVPNNTVYLGDVFPIAIVDNEVLPASAAAKYVLQSTK